MYYKTLILVLFLLHVTMHTSAPSESLWRVIRTRRDAVLQQAHRKSQQQLVTMFFPFFEDALEKGIMERRALLGADPNHCSHAIDIIAFLQEAITRIMHEHHMYRSLKPEDIGVLNIAQTPIPKEYGSISPVFIFPVFHHIAVLKKYFSGAKAVLCFDPRAIRNIEELESAIGHELVHAVQPQLTKIISKRTRFRCEVEADIKNLCIQNTDGMWRLRGEAAALIDNMYVLLTQEKEYVLHKLTYDLEGEKKEVMETLFYACVRKYYGTHPLPAERREYMQEFVAVLRECGVMAEAEIQAFIDDLVKHFYRNQ